MILLSMLGAPGRESIRGFVFALELSWTPSRSSTSKLRKNEKMLMSGSSLLGGRSGTIVTEAITAITTFCPSPTTLTRGTMEYTATKATTLTIKDCSCTVTKLWPTGLSYYNKTLAGARTKPPGTSSSMLIVTASSGSSGGGSRDGSAPFISGGDQGAIVGNQALHWAVVGVGAALLLLHA
ncbi:hypothetical protein B0H63DRAFT_529899 [Podospora didyma]|uniref:Uncharacterized protein n=1 Tax=Podospora didyma TaxID=330526 RepID=A0AAE0JY83_9PEZI|nr:hypothetical protein B0H63DRAFT_529899 [Podospora didyma]